MKSLLSLIVMLLPTGIFAQSFLLQHAIPEPAENFHYDRLYTKTDSVGQRLYVIALAENVMYVTGIQMPGFSVLHELSTAIVGERGAGEYQGATTNGDTLTVLMLDDRSQLHLYGFIFSNGNTLHSLLQPDDKKERIISAFTFKNRIVYLSKKEPKNKSQQEFAVYKERPDGVFESLSYHFTREVVQEAWGATVFQRSYVPDKLLFMHPFVKNYFPVKLEDCASHNRLYQEDNVLYLTAEYKEGTEVLRMDILSGEANRKFYRSTGPVAWTDCSNSYIAGNYLYQIRVSDDQLVISVSDVRDGQLKKVYSLSEQQDPLLNKSPYYNERQNLLFATKSKPLEGFAAFIKRLKGNPALIACTRVNGQVFLTAGVLKIESSPSTYGSVSSLSSNAVYFTTSLLEDGFENVEPDGSIAARYQELSKYFEESSVKPGIFSLFPGTGAHYICFYNQRSGKIYISTIGL